MSILIKDKPCKGTGKAKGFKGCGTLQKFRKYGLGINCKCYSKWLRESLEGQEMILKASKKARMYSVVEDRKKKASKMNRLKESIKTISDYKKELQKEINTIVRLIDYGQSCICTDSKNGKMNAGHYVSIGSNDTIRYHLENIWLQSEYSNTYKSGDTLKYQQGIIKMFGKDYLDYMNSLQSIKPIKLSVSELKEKIIITRKIVKELKENPSINSVIDRIEIRRKLNKRIGIYFNI